MTAPWETVWSFNTPRFTVRLDVTPEDDDPEGHFDYPEDVEFAREGGWAWFAARVQVVFRDDDNPKHWAVPRRLVLGEDYLGACSYHGLSDFKSGGYFRDMVAEAISDARGKLERMSLLLHS